MPEILFKRKLSKSQYTRGLQCVKSLWLYNYRKDLREEVSEGKQAIFDEGTEVGKFARTYYKGGVLLKKGREDIPGALQETQDLLAKGETVLYEAAFQAGNVLVFCDILRKTKEGWQLIEVKGSTKLKPQYLGDIAIQKHIITAAGIKIKRAFLMNVNNEFVKKGPIDPKEFFNLEDVTEEIKEAEADIPANLKEFFAALGKPDKEPAIGIGGHCSDPYACDFQPYCWDGVPGYSVYNFARLDAEIREKLISKGIIAVKDFPKWLDLSDAQADFVQAAKTGKPIIRPESVKEFVDSLTCPVYHLDFETVNPAIPLYDGQSPFKQTPFQVSLDVESADGKLKHFEYLADGKTDPRPDIIDFLLKNIGHKGTPMAFSAGFEKSVIRGLAKAFPKFEKKLLALAERFVDLAVPFRSRHVLFPQFEGGYSMKVVLPTLIPGMTYEGMPIANGEDAQVAFKNIMSGKLSKIDETKTRRDLLAYCGQDTLAMVKVLDWLKKVE